MKFFIRSSRRILSPIILLMGGPGSGKGVLAHYLSALQHVSIGEQLRQASSGNDAQSHRIKQRMKSGELLQDDMIFDVLLMSPELQIPQPLLLDGFPRTLSQWAMLKGNMQPPSAIIDLRVDESVIQKRLSTRGRFDDEPGVIQNRIKDYFENTRPMADQIIGEHEARTCVIDSSQLNPEDVAKIACSFLYDLGLYPHRGLTDDVFEERELAI